MKLILIIASAIFMLSVSSCSKCETCTPYYYNASTNTIGAIDTGFGGAQAIKLCDKTDIKSYESLTNFKDAAGHTVKFTCQ